MATPALTPVSPRHRRRPARSGGAAPRHRRGIIAPGGAENDTAKPADSQQAHQTATCMWLRARTRNA